MITACLIVRDEAARLAQCLAQVQEIVSQIVVVDTGSTDGSQATARRSGAEIYEAPFTDFAHARNAALERARGDWILAIDPDEFFEPGHLSRLVDLTRRRDVFGCLIPRYDYLGRFGWSLSHPCRLFRNLPGVAYRRAVFEEPEFPTEFPGQIVCVWDISIHHYGFQLPERMLSEKRLLYSGLLQSGSNLPDEPWASTARALLKADSGDINTALRLMDAQAPSAKGTSQRQVAVQHAKLLFAAGRHNDALVKIGDSLIDERGTGYRESRLHNLMGLVMGHSSRIDDARDSFKRAIQCSPQVAAYWLNLAVAQKRLGQIAECRRACAIAAKLNPRILETHVGRPTTYDYQQHWIHRLDTDSKAASLVGSCLVSSSCNNAADTCLAGQAFAPFHS